MDSIFCGRAVDVGGLAAELCALRLASTGRPIGRLPGLFAGPFDGRLARLRT
jgi:hypothetical protein